MLQVSRLGGLLLFVVLAATACSEKSSVRVASAKSLNGQVEAVLSETNVDATTDFGYEIELRAAAPGADLVKVATLYGAGRSEQAYGVNLVWLNNQILELQYLTAKKAQIEKPVIVIGGQAVTVQLRPGVLDRNAPPGGMEYNLHRQ